jgi:hypothetical protein
MKHKQHSRAKQLFLNLTEPEYSSIEKLPYRRIFWKPIEILRDATHGFHPDGLTVRRFKRKFPPS